MYVHTPKFRPLWLAMIALVVLWGCEETDKTEDTPDAGSADALLDAQEDVPPPVELPAGWCDVDDECAPDDLADLPMCKTYGCIDNACAIIPIEDGLACDDGDGCTLEDACAAGECVGTALTCDDENPCTTDACDQAHGCVNTFNQKPCDDLDACTVEDACFQGECAGKELKCDDGNPCTDDTCDEDTGCIWEANSGPCDDGSLCTNGDVCEDGACVPGPELDCQVANPCIQGTCDPEKGCEEILLDTECDDADECTSDDICVAGACEGTPVVCDDANPCTTDFCDALVGCKASPNTDPCDDGDPCTLEDTCSASQCVSGAPNPNCCETADTCEDNDPCTVAGCEEDGFCSFTPLDCDDGVDCTVDTCSEGTCSSDPVGSYGEFLTLDEGFEAGSLSGWAVETSNGQVTWQLDTLNVHEGLSAVYCGNKPEYSYDFGTTKASLSRWISVPSGAGATLNFMVLQDVAELLTCNHDVTRVRINDEVIHELCGSLPQWTLVALELGDWQGKTVKLTLEFDTVDEQANKGQGVWIDDLRVVSGPALECCTLDADCGDQALCSDPVCHATDFECATPSGSEACDDGDSCTLDTCGEDGQCGFEPIEGCCNEDSDCPGDDELACAVGVCTEDSVCAVDESGCCDETSCDDSDACTTDSCGADGLCAFEPIEGCCAQDTDCDDSDPCTADSCGEDGQCVNAAIEGCCAQDTDCDDSDPCTADSCGEDGQCVNAAIEGCCAQDTDCDDSDACTDDVCDLNTNQCENSDNGTCG